MLPLSLEILPRTCGSELPLWLLLYRCSQLWC
jgi:hypothetical protein